MEMAIKITRLVLAKNNIKQAFSMIYLLCNPFATILATDGSATPPLLIIANLMLSVKQDIHTTCLSSAL
jgi:hypothetical protein